MGKVVAIDGEDYRIDDVEMHRKKDSQMIAAVILNLVAIDDPQNTTRITIPYSTLFAVGNTLLSLKDVGEEFRADFESLAQEAMRVSAKFTEKLSRSLDAFAEEFKKK